jgi:CO/xanthine dehydrogenase FAD-binding subunit
MPKPRRKTTAGPERRVVFDTLIAAVSVAGDIGTELGRVARLAAQGALTAAVRLSQAANDLVDPKVVRPAGPRAGSSVLPEAALAAIGGGKPRQKAQGPGRRAARRRKPLAPRRARRRPGG